MLVLLAFSAGPVPAPADDGTGVKVIRNAKDPAPPAGTAVKAVIRPELTIGGGAGSADAALLQPTDLTVDDAGNIYVLDQKAGMIKAYDRDGKLLRTIGRKGQGPGEFQKPRDIGLTPRGELMVSDTLSRRISFFSTDGRLLKEIPAGKMWLLNRVEQDREGNIYGSHTIVGDEARTEIVKFAPDLKPLLPVASVLLCKFPEVDPFMPQICFDLLDGGRLVWGMTTEYDLRIIGSDGKSIMRITKDHEPLKITSADREEKTMEDWGGEPPSDVKVVWPANFPAFRDFAADDNGRLFVRPYKGVKEERPCPYDVFDAAGAYMAKITLPARARAIKAGKIYTIEEDADGNPLVKRYALEWK